MHAFLCSNNWEYFSPFVCSEQLQLCDGPVMNCFPIFPGHWLGHSGASALFSRISYVFVVCLGAWPTFFLRFSSQTNAPNILIYKSLVWCKIHYSINNGIQPWPRCSKTGPNCNTFTITIHKWNKFSPAGMQYFPFSKSNASNLNWKKRRKHLFNSLVVCTHNLSKLQIDRVPTLCRVQHCCWPNSEVVSINIIQCLLRGCVIITHFGPGVIFTGWPLNADNNAI